MREFHLSRFVTPVPDLKVTRAVDKDAMKQALLLLNKDQLACVKTQRGRLVNQAL
jgi:hypothetical protein